MIPLLAAAVLVAGAPIQQDRYDTDTTFAVEPGTRLRVHNQGGDIVVRAWDRNEIRVRAEHSRRSELRVDRNGSTLDLNISGRMGMPSTADYRIDVPVWMPLDLGGLYTEVSVEGTRAPVKVGTIEGDVTVRGGQESVSVSAINGEIDVSGVRGRVDLTSASGSIFVTDAEGDIRVEAISGDIQLRNVTARRVDAQTVSGEIVFTGRIFDQGSYILASHSGDVVIGIAESSNATLRLATASGDFRTDYQVRSERVTRRRRDVRLGSGSASVEVDTFSGDIRLVRPDDVPALDRSERNLRRQRPDHDQDSWEDYR